MFDLNQRFLGFVLAQWFVSGCHLCSFVEMLDLMMENVGFDDGECWI